MRCSAGLPAASLARAAGGCAEAARGLRDCVCERRGPGHFHLVPRPPKLRSQVGFLTLERKCECVRFLLLFSNNRGRHGAA